MTRMIYEQSVMAAISRGLVAVEEGADKIKATAETKKVTIYTMGEGKTRIDISYKE